MAASLGADVPFFLRGGWQLGQGTGEKLDPLPPPPGGPWSVRLFVPPWGISTAAAYRSLDEGSDRTPARPIGPFLSALASGDRDAVTAASHNRFEAVLENLEPRQAALADALRRLGGLPARLSGSGSALWCWADGPPSSLEPADGEWRGRLARAGWPGMRVFGVGLAPGSR